MKTKIGLSLPDSSVTKTNEHTCTQKNQNALLFEKNTNVKALCTSLMY